MNKKLVLLTEPPTLLNLDKIKVFVKKYLGIKRGPSTVTESLVRGLTLAGISFDLNPNTKTIRNADIVHVISSTHALAYCVEQKKKGYIKHLMAGPTIVVDPKEANSIILSDEIEKLVLPSQWSIDYWNSKDSKLASKTEVWASSVKDPYINGIILKQKRKQIVIYDKMGDPRLVEETEKILSSKRVKVIVFKYGKFNQTDFFAALEESIGMIYFSLSESQGLALQEAWTRNVPTFVLENDTWYYNSDIWRAPKINAPYLDDRSGYFFKDIEALEKIINDLLEGRIHFDPRAYCNQYFSDEVSVRRYIQIISNLHS